MIIKRWNGSAFVKEFPQTKAQLIRNAADNGNIFDTSDKIFPTYLPNSVFDGLNFYSTTTGAVGALGPRTLLAAELVQLMTDSENLGRSVKGNYFVISTAGTITGLTNIEDTLNTNEYVTLQFRPTDGGNNATLEGAPTPVTSSGALEVGDWFVIESVTGAGTIGNPWVFTASVINNTYENATTALDGIVRLSSRTTYAALSGNNVVTEGVLKTVVDNAAFAAGSHTHGSLTSDGKLTNNEGPVAGQHLVITNPTDFVNQSSITFGTTTTSFLNNAGGWTTPTGTYVHPVLTSRSIDTTGVDVLDVFTSNTDGHVTNITTRTLPNATTSAAGVMTGADKTKLDGIATNANNYSHPNHTGDVTSTGDGATVIGTGAVTNAKIAFSAVTFSKIQDIAGNSVIGNDQGTSGISTTITAANDGDVLRRSTGVLSFGLLTGSNLNANTVTNSNLSNMAASRIKGRITASTGAPEDLTGANVRTIIELAAPIYVQTATPTTTVTHSLWYDIN